MAAGRSAQAGGVAAGDSDAESDVDHDLVRSEVHVGVSPTDAQIWATRVCVRVWPVSKSSRPEVSAVAGHAAAAGHAYAWPGGPGTDINVDSDGDLLPPRRNAPAREAAQEGISSSVVLRRKTLELTLTHALATRLPHVGLQLWAGAFLMVDWLVAHAHMLRGKVVLELGAGCGLAGLVAAAAGAARVYLTDAGDRVLTNCAANAAAAAGCYPAVCVVRRLDWLTPPAHARGARCSPSRDSGSDPFAWQAADESPPGWPADIILAADCVYDPELTEGLLQQIEAALKGLPPHQTQRPGGHGPVTAADKASPRVCWLSLERRVNFSIEALAAVSPAYDHFVEALDARAARGGLRGRRMDTSQLERCCDVDASERSADLQLWELSLGAGEGGASEGSEG